MFLDLARWIIEYFISLANDWLIRRWTIKPEIHKISMGQELMFKLIAALKKDLGCSYYSRVL